MTSLAAPFAIALVVIAAEPGPQSPPLVDAGAPPPLVVDAPRDAGDAVAEDPRSDDAGVFARRDAGGAAEDAPKADAPIALADAGPSDADLLRDQEPVSDAGAAVVDAERAPPVGVPATYHGAAAPLVFHLPVATRSAADRARRATRAIEAVLDDGMTADDAESVNVVVEDGVAIVRIRSTMVAELTEADAAHTSATLHQLAERLESELRVFVAQQLRRRALQFFFLHIFISVFIVVIGVLAVRTLRTAFDKWDAALDDKRGSLEPITVFRIPVVSSTALGGGLTFGLFFGRIISYVASFAAVVATVLSQFEATRPLLERLLRFTSAPIVRGFESVVGSLPGLVLAGLLVLATLGLLRVAMRLLDGVQESKIRWRRVPPERVPVARTGVAWIAFLVALPLVIAAAFGRFGTPIETIALLFTLAVALATVPVLASGLAGLFMLWTRVVQPGDWISCAGVTGEVSSLSITEVRLVPADGGSATLSPLLLLVRPVQRLARPPSTRVSIALARSAPVAELVQLVAETARSVDKSAPVELVHVDDEKLVLEVEIARTSADLRGKVLLAVAGLAESGKVSLARQSDR